MSQALPKNTRSITNPVVKDLMQNVKRLQNGDISRIMNRMGLLYRYNYGVSIPQLREMANKHEANMEVARILFQQDIREAKILASFLCKHDELTQDMAMEMGLKLKNQELIEQFSRNIFSKLSYLPDLINNWQLDDNWAKILCFYSLGWKFKMNDDHEEALLEWLLEKTPEFAFEADTLTQQAIGFAMQSVGVKSEQNKAKMAELADQMLTSEKKSARRIAEDYLWLNAL